MARPQINLFRSNLPASKTLTGTEVVEKAREAGMETTAANLSRVRTHEKKRSTTAVKPKASKKPAVGAKVAKTPANIAVKASPAPKPKSASPVPTKADFVRSMPRTMPVKEVVAAAKLTGVVITEKYVYNVRSAVKMGKAAKAGSKKPVTKKPASLKTKAAPPTSPRSAAPLSKSAFIRTMPLSMPANEVVEKAKAAGIVVSANTVHSVRSKGKAKKPSPVANAAPKTLNKPKAAPFTRAPVKTAPATSSNDEVAFRRLVLGLGVVRARQLLGALEAGLAALIGG